MKTLLILEEIAQFMIATFFFYQFQFDCWVFPVVLFLPDISMFGYLITPSWGAFSYNFIHHKGVAIAVIILGFIINDTPLQGIGLVLFAHSAMDRVFGYGLKYSNSFKSTHLGLIGK
jgi:hypothetical protein